VCLIQVGKAWKAATGQSARGPARETLLRLAGPPAPPPEAAAEDGGEEEGKGGEWLYSALELSEALAAAVEQVYIYILTSI
jgi:hypothetical protein